MDTLLLIDGNSLINRAFYALPPLNNNQGQPTQAVYGFTQMLIKAILDYKPDGIVVAFDLSGGTFRHSLYKDYKATRKGMPEDLAKQMPILKTLLKIMNIEIAELSGFEADDIIGTLAKKHNGKTLILTGDRDSLQLVDDNITVILTKKGITETLAVTGDNIKELFSLTASQIIDYKSLAGDSSDNIPGVAGVGDKTATDLLSKYDTLDGVFQNIDKITGKLNEKLLSGKESAYLSYKLATIKMDVDICIEDYSYDFPLSQETKRFFIDNSFKSLYKRDELFNETAKINDFDTVQSNVDVKIVEVIDEDNLLEVISKISDKVSIFFGEDINICFDDKTEYLIKINRTLIDTGIEYSVVLKSLKKIFTDDSIVKNVFDAKSIMHKLDAFDVELNNYNDIKLMCFISDMSAENEILSLCLLAENLPKELPAWGMTKLYELYFTRLNESNRINLYSDVELPLVKVLFSMEKEGVKIDTLLLNSLGETYQKECNELTERIHSYTKSKFNINSPKQLSEVLFDELKIPYPSKSKKLSTNFEVLSQIEYQHPIVPLILKYRSVSKLNSTYVEGFKKLLTNGNIIKTEYKQMLTTTGRLSSVEPNIQNIPVREEDGRVLRGLFIAKEDNYLVAADYSQIELRLLAHFSEDPKMISLYKNGDDIHSMTASEIFGVPLSSVTPEMRRSAKTVNFGIIYGMSEYGLAQNLKCPVSTAKNYIKKYFEKFSAIKAYFEKTVEDAKKTSEARTLLGRVRKIPELFSANYMTRQFGERAAMNMPLQGSAADIIKIAMVDVDNRLKNMKSKLILQIHDELIIETAKDELDDVKEILRSAMEDAYSLKVPLIADVKFGKSWLECK